MTQAFNLAQLANNLNTSGQLDATDGLSGAVPIANGGTGQTSASNAINALLPSQTSNSGKYLTTNGSAASWGTVSQKLVTVHYYTNSTRQVTSSSSNYNYFTWTLTKVSATSDLYFHVGMPAYAGDNSGMYIGIGIDGSYNFTGFGCTDTPAENFFVMLQKRSGIGSGNRTITLNQIPIDGTSNRTLNIINPNNSEDVRNQQMGTNFIVYEIEP